MNHHLTGAMVRARNDDLDRAADARLRRAEAIRDRPDAATAPAREQRAPGLLGRLRRRGAPAPVLAAGSAAAGAVSSAVTAVGDAAGAVPDAALGVVASVAASVEGPGTEGAADLAS